MSIPPENIERGVAAGYRQPLSDDDLLQAQALERYVHDINCVNNTGPRLHQVVFRSSYDDHDLRNHVFRWDLRDYREIFTNGFRAWPQGQPFPRDVEYYNLLAHINEGGTPVSSRDQPRVPRAFVSTTLNAGMRFRLSNPVGTLIYRYEIYAPGGILVQASVGDRGNFAGQREIAYVGGIDRQYIRAAQIFRIAYYTRNGYPRMERAELVVVINAYFNPQSHPERLIEINRPCIFYFEQRVERLLRVRIYPSNIEHQRERREAKETDGSKAADDEIIYTDYVPNQESDDPAATLEFYTPDSPAGIIDWYTTKVADLKGYVDAAFRSSRPNEAYLFMRNEYILVNYAPASDRIVSGPSLICDGFPSLEGTTFGEYGIDCAFGHHEKGVAFIFSGNLCAILNHEPESKNDKMTTGPVTIPTMFPFFKGTEFESGIDAAFEGPTKHEAYLFTGEKYACINHVSRELIAQGPIVEGFPGLRGTVFESGIEAAFASHCQDEAYVFKGKSFAVVDFSRGTITDGVKEIVPNWPSLATILPRMNKGVDVHDHEPIKSAEATDDVPHVHDELK